MCTKRMSKMCLACLIAVSLISILTIPNSFGEIKIFDNAPTLGISQSDLKKQVANGFTYNEKPVNVELYFTPYKLQFTKVGQENIAKFKIFDYRGTDNIAHFEFAFGLEKGQTINDSKIRIEWDKDLTGQEKITVIDPQNILENVRVEKSIEKCKKNGKVDCLVLIIYHTFRESPKGEIIATNVWNHQRYAWQNYYNHGLKVQGDSLNPLKSFTGVHEGKLYELTQFEDKATDKNGDSWSFTHNVWIKDHVAKPRPQDPLWNVMSRTNSQFPVLVANQIEIAEDTLKTICVNCTDDNFAEINNIKQFKYKEQTNKLDDRKIKKIMKQENDKATQTMKLMFAMKYPGKVFTDYNSVEKIKQK